MNLTKKNFKQKVSEKFYKIVSYVPYICMAVINMSITMNVPVLPIPALKSTTIGENQNFEMFQQVEWNPKLAKNMISSRRQ